MEKRLKRIEVILIITLVMVIVNLFYTILSSDSSPDDMQQIDQISLPGDMQKSNSDELVFEIRAHYNDANWDGMYDMFSAWAQAQIEMDEISSTFEKLKPVTGTIGTYSYSYYEYSGFDEGADWFELFYKCRFKNGKGTIKLTIRAVDGTSEIVGISINLDEI